MLFLLQIIKLIALHTSLMTQKLRHPTAHEHDVTSFSHEKRKKEKKREALYDS